MLCLEEGKVHALSLIREDDVDTVSKVGGEKGPEEKCSENKTRDAIMRDEDE